MNDIDASIAAPANAAVRIAYTLNNTQPVLCTYISAEPLFYLDEAVTDDADLDLPLDMLADFDAPEFGPTTEVPHDFSLEGENALTVFGEQFSVTSGPGPSLNDMQDTLAKSRMGSALLSYARDHGIQIITKPQLDAAHYDRMAGIISLRPQLPAAEQLLLCVRELRRVWQHRNGALIHPLLFHPDHAIVINRVHAADLATMMVRVAWELRLAGDDTYWTHMERHGHDDLTRGFAREALADFRSLNDGRAMAGAFEAWFISERCRGYDRSLIQQMLADYQGYVFKAGHEETSKVLTQQLLASLGTMPFGKNYLSPHAATILADPIFTDIRDRSNANFLWFIKFEQSFRQTERDLQNAGELPSSSPKVRPANAPQAQIIHLPVEARTGRRSVPAKRVVGSNDAVIIDLQGWRRDRSFE
jgi:hypothetical protein